MVRDEGGVGVVSDLEEGEDEAHGEVGDPVEGAPHDVGGGPVGLLEELRRHEEGHARCNTAYGHARQPTGAHVGTRAITQVCTPSHRCARQHMGVHVSTHVCTNLVDGTLSFC